MRCPRAARFRFWRRNRRRLSRPSREQFVAGVGRLKERFRGQLELLGSRESARRSELDARGNGRRARPRPRRAGQRTVGSILNASKQRLKARFTATARS